MPGRPLPSEADMIAGGYGRPDMVRRRAILRETLDKLNSAAPPNLFHKIAANNLARWHAEAATPEPAGEVRVLSGDWGEVTLRLTKEHGVCFAALNMANPYVPGGGYVEGMVAQEGSVRAKSFTLPERQCRILPPLIFLSFSVTFRAG